MLDLLAEAAAWTRARGFENWPAQFSPRLMVKNVTHDELYVVERGAAIIATFTLQWSDEFFWGPDDAQAGYVHRLAVRRAQAGAGVGYRLLDWAADRARAQGRAALRLDVVSDNRPLRDYYEAAGFAHLRDLTGEFAHDDGTRTSWQTSLYQRECAPAKT